MLKGIPSIVSPQLLKILAEMGHRDEIMIADRNFPAQSMAKNIVRLDGHLIPPILHAVLSLMPIDDSEYPITLESANTVAEPPIWNEYRKIISSYDRRGDKCIQTVSKDVFYEKLKNCYAIIATGEPALYGNIILKKGLVLD